MSQDQWELTNKAFHLRDGYHQLMNFASRDVVKKKVSLYCQISYELFYSTASMLWV